LLRASVTSFVDCSASPPTGSIAMAGLDCGAERCDKRRCCCRGTSNLWRRACDKNLRLVECCGPASRPQVQFGCRLVGRRVACVEKTKGRVQRGVYSSRALRLFAVCWRRHTTISLYQHCPRTLCRRGVGIDRHGPLSTTHMSPRSAVR
jgi:hypothetical protein